MLDKDKTILFSKNIKPNTASAVLGFLPPIMYSSIPVPSSKSATSNIKFGVIIVAYYKASDSEL